jgi:hypothetical protein
MRLVDAKWSGPVSSACELIQSSDGWVSYWWYGGCAEFGCQAIFTTITRERVRRPTQIKVRGLELVDLGVELERWSAESWRAEGTIVHLQWMDPLHAHTHADGAQERAWIF